MRLNMVPGQQDGRARESRGGDADASFAIVPHHADCYLRITIRGLWNGDLMSRYRTELRRLTLRMVATGRYRGALLDASDYAIQPAAVAAGHAEAMRIARSRFDVHASVLMRGERPRLQMSRITQQTGHRLFATEADALSWLCG